MLLVRSDVQAARVIMRVVVYVLVKESEVRLRADREKWHVFAVIESVEIIILLEEGSNCVLLLVALSYYPQCLVLYCHIFWLSAVQFFVSFAC